MTRPLRKIVGHETRVIAPGVSVQVEVLECGHRQRPRQDIYGETNASSRRCRQCGKRECNDREDQEKSE